MTIGSRINSLRTSKGITQAQLAEKLGVSFQAVSNWERDEHLPDTDKLASIARALDSTVASLMGEDRGAPARLEHGRPLF